MLSLTALEVGVDLMLQAPMAELRAKSVRLVDLFLAALILFGLPGTAAWAIGLLVGINLVFGGSTLISMALQARSLAPSAPGASAAAR